MIIPIRTDYRRKNTPWVNYGLVLVNVLLFVFGYNASDSAHQARISQWMLEPDLPTLEQFFSCMFLHANWGHLLGNMIFLWVFGNGWEREATVRLKKPAGRKISRHTPSLKPGEVKLEGDTFIKISLKPLEAGVMEWK